MFTNSLANIDINSLKIRSELRPGDVGWIVGKHSLQYEELFGQIANPLAIVKNEIIVAKELANYFEKLAKDFENFWIAEIDGINVGFVLIRKLSDSVAKFTKFMVVPMARGRGIGSRLADAAIGFARDRGYTRVTLRTHREMRDAARVYGRKGFRCVAEEVFNDFGPKLMLDHYELVLKSFNKNKVQLIL